MKRMAWRKNLIGKCHLCGDTTLLTFEHVPPGAAFNDCGVLEADIRRLMGANLRDELTNPRGREKQKGAGGHTLCARCNNDTGAWYADSYVELVKQAYPLAHSLNKDQRAIAIFNIQPLNVLKQILVMFCTACPPDFAAKNPALVRFLLNRECRAFPQDLGVYLGLFDIRRSAAARQSGISARLDAQSGTAHIYSEISFPPLTSS
jgi:hypothetical protein